MTNCTDTAKWGSNYGQEVTVVAPGINIPTTDNSGQAGKVSSDYLMDFNGTSAATPLVAGVAALILSRHPDWNAWQVRDKIAQSSDDLGPAGQDDRYGFGRVNACRALDLLVCDEGVSGRIPGRTMLLAVAYPFSH
jgi:subtilisin family serine protease